MKLMEKIIRVSLVLMILLSLFLTWKIWNNSGNKQVAKRQTSNTEQSSSAKHPTDIFLPVKLVYQDQDGKHLYTNKEREIQELSRLLVKDVIGKKTELLDGKKIELVDRKNSFDLSMSDDLSLLYFLKMNEMPIPNELDNKLTFRRIAVSLEDKEVAFLDEDNHVIYELPLSDDSSQYEKILKNEKNNYIEVNHDDSILPVYYEFSKPINLPKYSYILATQSYSLFSQAFFLETDELVSNNDDPTDRDVNLASPAGNTFNVKYDTGEISYNGLLGKEVDSAYGTETFVEDSFFFVKNIGNSFGTLRYFEGTEEAVTYRNYVEGYPVFSDDTKGRLEFTKKDKGLHIETNQETIQVPIPSKEEVTLSTTKEAVMLLNNYGIAQKDIQGLQIGYTWLSNQETKQVVDLTPEWYVKTNDVWESIEQVIERVTKGGE
ncbi:YycH family regulatory protein [Vagococcus coleopterorum]|nr:two-component system activity regulator YycH [Vagococcus coleopterorum]